VSRVTRIHNRFLRNRFEERLETLVDVSDPTYKRSLEYLFYGESPGGGTALMPSLCPLFVVETTPDLPH
jgi:hypothetical protein